MSTNCLGSGRKQKPFVFRTKTIPNCSNPYWEGPVQLKLPESSADSSNPLLRIVLMDDEAGKRDEEICLPVKAGHVFSRVER